MYLGDSLLLGIASVGVCCSLGSENLGGVFRLGCKGSSSSYGSSSGVSLPAYLGSSSS